ncbi:hypothetical protein F52700_8431 [Fusarium sp. NRRL 52700]|nr:hypothetical protein F52700_8431 [Fusarium sp. NRRL 52700]
MIAYYRGICPTNFRSYKRILKNLILALETEHVNLQNICEKLLMGIAPQMRIEEMVRDSFGDLWREEEIFNKLRLRLWSSLQVFDDRVQDMRDAIENMMEKLNVGTDGKKSNHEEVLTRIRDGVSALQRLAVLNTDLGSQRKSRSQERLNKLDNGMLGGIYHALRSTMTCTCSGLHDVGLRLTPPSRTVIPEDDDEDVIKELQFRLAVPYLTGSQVNTSKQWNEILLESGENSTTSTVSFTTQSTSTSRKTAGFAVPSTTSSTNTHQSQTVVIESALTNRTLNTLRTICDEWSLVPPEQVLQDPAPLYGDKLRLAWMTACGVLQIQATPWVAVIPRSEDIFIAQKTLPRISQSQRIISITNQSVHALSRNSRPVNSNAGFVPNSNIGALFPRSILDYEAANKLLGRVMMTGGPGYYNAVERCLRSDMQIGTAGGSCGSQGDVISGVLDPLEQDLRRLVV